MVPYASILALCIVYGRKTAEEKLSEGNKPQLTTTVFVPTFNEEKYVARKLENILSQTERPREILVFDCSTDGTRDIVKKYMESNPNIRLVPHAERKGVPRTLNEALKLAKGEIFVYTGCDSFTDSELAFETLISNFSDPRVGGVTGICENTGLEGQFRKFTNWIQQAESNLDSTIVAHGGPSLVAFRVQLAEPVKEDSLADDTEEFVKIRKKGFRTLVDPRVISREVIPDNFYSRRIQKDRRAQGIIRVLLQNMRVAFNPRYGAYGLVVFPMDLFLLVVSPFVILFDLVLLGYVLFNVGAFYFLGLVSVIAFSLLSTKMRALIDLQLAGLLGSIRAALGIGSTLWPKDRLRPS